MNSYTDTSLVIVAYRPHKGKEEQLKAVVANHVPALARLGLVTSRVPAIMEAKDGTIIEVFEWLSADAIKQAHSHPGVHKIWADFAAVCDCVPLNTVAETADMFAGFKPLN